MALTTKLLLRQGQSLVMTPQLLQAIKLLQFSNIELAASFRTSWSATPLLERAERSAGMWIFPADTNHAEAASESDFQRGGRGRLEFRSLRHRPRHAGSQSRHRIIQHIRRRPPPDACRTCAVRRGEVVAIVNSWSGAPGPASDSSDATILRPTSRPKLACGSIFPRNWCWPQKIRSSGRSAKR